NSHSGEYGWAAEQFVADGLAVYAGDLRGRGKSDGERFFVNSLSEWVSDVATVMTLAKAREPGLPVFILGHSAGRVVSCICALALQRGTQRRRLVVLHLRARASVRACGSRLRKLRARGARTGLRARGL